MASGWNVARTSDDDGSVYLRGATLAAFFLEKPFHEAAPAVLSVFDDYLALVPAGALRWASVGAASEEWKPAGKTTFDRARAQLAPAAAKKRLSSFELQSGDEGGEAPEHAFTTIGGPVEKEFPDEKGLVQMVFPAAAVDGPKADAFAARIKALAAKLPYAYGYASPSLQIAELHAPEGFTEAKALAARYPGLDVQNNESSRSELGNRTRGARWLSFLGPALVKKLKGEDAIRKALPKAVAVEPAGAGLLIRAGDAPEIGDANKKLKTPLLRAVAELLEPVTYFEEQGLATTDFGFEDPDFFKAWERRFLD